MLAPSTQQLQLQLQQVQPPQQQQPISAARLSLGSRLRPSAPAEEIQRHTAGEEVIETPRFFLLCIMLQWIMSEWIVLPVRRRLVM